MVVSHEHEFNRSGEDWDRLRRQEPRRFLQRQTVPGASKSGVEELSTDESRSLRENENHCAEVAALRLVHGQRVSQLKRTATTGGELARSTRSVARLGR
jgi:hypothetical protein